MKKINQAIMKGLFFIAFASVIMFSSCSNKKSVTVWVATPWERVLRETPPPAGQTQPQVALKAAANEYEPFRLIIHNSSNQSLSNLYVAISDLKSDSSSISAENIKLFRAYYVDIDTPSNRVKSPDGFYPDALLPFGNQTSNAAFQASPFSIDTAQNAEIWCDLYVPKGTAAGDYKGQATVTKDGKKIAEIPVSISVWKFELPEKIAMASHFGSLNTTAIEMMGKKGDSLAIDDLTNKYNDVLLQHRAVPSTPKSVWPEWNEKEGIKDNGASDRMKDFVEEHHANALDIPFLYNDQPAKCQAYLRAIAKWLKDLGYLNMAYVYMEDEPNTKEQYDLVRKQGAMIKAADPGIGRMCTEQTITSNKDWGTLYGAVNIWCPLWGLWNDSTAQQRLAAGEKLWSYTALCQGPEGTPWWQIDTEPLNFRAPFWTSWHYNIIGYLYWQSTWWNTYKTLEGVYNKPSFRGKFWGEGMLLYPGDPAGVQGFVPSIRLKLYREAMEDYEYMVMAAAKSKGDVDNIVNGISTSFQKWSHEPADYEKAREALAGIITK